MSSLNLEVRFAENIILAGEALKFAKEQTRHVASALQEIHIKLTNIIKSYFERSSR